MRQLVPLLALILSGSPLLPGCGAGTTYIGDTPPGDIENFRAIRVYPAIKKYAGEGVELIRIHTENVRPDGSIDLTVSYDDSFTKVGYEFIRERADRPDVPIGAGANKTHVKVGVGVRAPFKRGTSSTHRGMRRGDHRPTKPLPTAPDPVCELSGLWERVIPEGAPENGVARILYDPYGYEFRIDEIEFRRYFGHDCRLAPHISYSEYRREFTQLRAQKRAGTISDDEFDQRYQDLRERRKRGTRFGGNAP